jgi:adenylate cyclase class 2
VEVEKRVKLVVGEKERLLRTLAARQITITPPIWQRDVYFAERGFRDRAHGPGSTIARVRYTPSKTTLNMKRLTSRAGVWEEIETGIEDGDVAERIMEAVGAEQVVVVEKRRRSGRFADIEIQLDEVVGLGSYLELSMLVDEEIGRARESLDRFLCDLEIPADRVELRGYPVILLEQQGVSFSAR